MLKQLVLTSLLTTGVATTTPVYNAPNLHNEEVITTDFTENINVPSQWNTLVTHNEGVNNSTTQQYNTGDLYDWSGKLIKTNNYINVLGNIYITQPVLPGGSYLETSEIMYFSNYTGWQQSGVHPNNTVRMMYCMQLTPYNINRNTNFDLGLTIAMGTLTPTGTDTVTFDSLYLQRKVYITSKENWSQYIDRQLSTRIVKNIEDDIEDPNSNYYYQLTDDVYEITNDISNGQYYEEINFEVIQNTTMYIFIEYIPMIKANWYDPGNQTTEPYDLYNVMNVDGEFFPVQYLKLSGTNYVANINYEVVDIPGLMWQILSMPFSFVSQAFNLTLFPGTPYQVNIANLFLSIVAIFVFTWLITLFLKMRG